MKRLCLIAALSLAACGEATATGRLADVSIIDRDTGSTLPLYYHRGDYWVAGTPGHRYSIQIASRQDGRLLAVTSVDGLNVLTGEGAGFNQRGYVYLPWQSYEITGWRKSNAEVAAFNFTALEDSYAARTGRPANVGVIGVALFRERPQPMLYEMPAAATSERRASGLDRPGLDLPAAPPPAAARAESNAADAAGKLAAAPELRSRQLGTGHGERESSWVQHVDFERESPRPNEIIRIRYDSVQNLIAMGVIRRPLPPNGRPQAFPGEALVGYVPDP
jgi:plasmid stabilization system protein ParE